MKTFLIAFNVRRNLYRDSESALVTKLKSYPKWAKPFEGVWLIKTERSTRQTIMDYLRSALNPEDQIMIIQVTNDWISRNLSPRIVEWLKSGL
jgi:hypothetical protein